MKYLKSNLPIVFMFVFGLIATAMLFFPALSFPNSDASFLGYEVVFGTEFINIGSYASGEIIWSPLGVLAYLLPLIAGFLLMYRKKALLASVILFMIGAILLFTLPLYTRSTATFFGTVTDIDIDWSMSYGLIIAAIFSTLGSLTCLLTLTHKK